jgi:CRISPR-associated protein Cas2
MVRSRGKLFVVVAYDVADDRRRARVVKVLEKIGVRVNFSVFECLVSRSRFEKLQQELAQKIDSKEDRVNYYPICVDCYSKIVYQPEKPRKAESTVVI